MIDHVNDRTNLFNDDDLGLIRETLISLVKERDVLGELDDVDSNEIDQLLDGVLKATGAYFDEVEYFEPKMSERKEQLRTVASGAETLSKGLITLGERAMRELLSGLKGMTLEDLKTLSATAASIRTAGYQAAGKLKLGCPPMRARRNFLLRLVPIFEQASGSAPTDAKDGSFFRLAWVCFEPLSPKLLTVPALYQAIPKVLELCETDPELFENIKNYENIY